MEKSGEEIGKKINALLFKKFTWVVLAIKLSSDDTLCKVQEKGIHKYPYLSLKFFAYNVENSNRYIITYS